MTPNWQQIVFRLGKATGSQLRVAQELGIGRGVLANLSRGATKEPRDFALCVRLLALYSERVAPVPGAIELARAVAR